MSASVPLSVLLVDPHPVFRAGLRAILEEDPRLRVVAETDAGAAVPSLVAARHPGVVVTELELADGSALPAIRSLKATTPGVRVLVVAARAETEAVLAALGAGADGFLAKRCGPAELVRGVLAVRAGERVLDRAAVAALVDRAVGRDASAAMEPLSDRERTVLDQLADGATSKESAAALGLRPKTVENHRARILDKLGAVNSAAAIRIAAAAGLLADRDGPGTG